MERSAAAHAALMAAALFAAGGAAAEAPLSSLKFGGQFRTRYEATSLDNYAPPSRRRSLDQLLFRTRLWAQASPVEGITAYLQLQDSRVSGSEASVASNEKNLDLHQGYIDVTAIGGLPLEARLGRMELSYGDQRLVSPLEWSNVMRAWDGLRLRAQREPWIADAFVTNLRDVAGPRRDQHFWGTYATCKGLPQHEFDLYLLGRDFGDNTQISESGTLGNLSDRTAGSRAKGRRGVLDYSGEFAYQFGRKAGGPVRAAGFVATFGVNPSVSGAPRFGGEYDFASGDKNPGDGRTGTFDPLFPFNHAYQGHADAVGWRNLHDFMATASVEALPGTRLTADYHAFRLVHAADGWYDDTGVLVARSAGGVAGRQLGQELDLYLRSAFRKVVRLMVGYAHFFPGHFVRSTVGGRDKSFAYAQAILDF